MFKNLTIIISIFLSINIAQAKTNDNLFITKYEYGKMLYNNPRGVSCKKCHGNKAKGKTIAKFSHTIKNKTYKCILKTSDITNVDIKEFKDKLNPNKKNKKIKFDDKDICSKLIYSNTMPKYFLTQDELDSLYYYIENVNDNE